MNSRLVGYVSRPSFEITYRACTLTIAALASSRDLGKGSVSGVFDQVQLEVDER